MISATDPERLPILVGERVVLRPAARADAPALAAILSQPAVAVWWQSFDEDRLRAELPEGFVVLVEDVVAGWLIFDEEADPEYPSVAFDIALGTAWHGRGLGPEALLLLARHFVAHGHHRFTIDPALVNEPAIRAYASIGFRPVGVLRAHERIPGGWRDSLLMDALAGELGRPASVSAPDGAAPTAPR